MKKYFILLLLTINSLLFAKTISFQDENFIGTISYNDIAKPGDAIFAKLNLKTAFGLDFGLVHFRH